MPDSDPRYPMGWIGREVPWPIEPEPVPTVEDYCAGLGHEYDGDDGEVGRCYCGHRTYPKGGGVDA